MQTATAGVATAAEEMNAGLGEEDAPTEYAADAEGVAAARADVQADFDAVEKARDDFRDTTTGQATGELGNGVSKYLGSTAKLTEANLTTALEGVQAEIIASTVVFNADGTVNTVDGGDFDLKTGDNNLLDLSGIDVENSGDITIKLAAFGDEGTENENNKDANNGGGKDTIILPDLADYAGTLTIENMILGQNPQKGFDTLVAPGLADAIAEVKVEANTVNEDYLDFTLTTTGGGDVLFSSLIKAETLLAQLNATLPQESQLTDVSAMITALVTAGPEGFVELLQEYGNLVNRASTNGLEKAGFTLAELQQEMLDAEAALEDARDAQSDAALLSDVRAAINAFAAAEGDTSVEVAPSTTLLALRTQIAGELDAEELDLDSVNDVTYGSSEALLGAFSGIEPSEAGKSIEQGGQGEWVNVGTEDKPELEYQPTAAEQGLLNALKAVEDRNTLIQAEDNTARAFASATVDGKKLGAELLAIEDRLELLAEAEQAVVDAQAELDGANELIDALEVALADLAEAEAWFTDQDMALPLALNEDRTATEDGDIYLFVEDTEEEGGFTITGFGEEGVDTLFFGADANFSLVSLAELGEDVTIQNRVGDNDTLEIFWQETDAGLELFVEADKAAGFDRGDLALDQMTQITLENFSAEAFADGTASFDGQSLIAGVAPTTTDEAIA